MQTIEKTTRNLDVTTFDLEFEVLYDPLSLNVYCTLYLQYGLIWLYGAYIGGCCTFLV